jgi:RNA polymerase sigma factor (sigma-70 family)
MAVSDEEILSKFKNPRTQNEAFNILLNQYQTRIYWHIRRMVVNADDADDLTQDVFVKIWKNLANFRQDAQLYTWMYKIASNEALSFLRKQKLRMTLSLESQEYYLSDSLKDGMHMGADKIEFKLQQALLTLPKKQLLVFNMKYFDDMPYEEMSKITGTSVGALKASYHHAVKKVEEFLKNDLNH